MSKKPRRKDVTPRRRRAWRRVATVLAAFALVAVGARLALPSVVRSYVLRTLDRDPVFAGEIGDVSIQLWRGAYAIEDVRIVKRAPGVPVPLFAASRVDFSLEWRALLAGEVVSQIGIERPELNFVDDRDEARRQSGAGAPWLEIIRDLSPFRVNRCDISDGTVHFRAFDSEPPVDVYLSNVEASIADLTNVHEDVTPLFARVSARATAMDEAAFDCEMRIDPLAHRPTFQLVARLADLDVTKMNSLARSYGHVDFERGRFDLVVELDARNGRVDGYVKPIFRDLVVLDIAGDLADGDVLGWFWQALVGGVSELFENQSYDQLATVIPLEGDLSHPDTDTLATIGNILRNAFVRAYLPRFEGTTRLGSGIVFGTGRPPKRQ